MLSAVRVRLWLRALPPGASPPRSLAPGPFRAPVSPFRPCRLSPGPLWALSRPCALLLWFVGPSGPSPALPPPSWASLALSLPCALVPLVSWASLGPFPPFPASAGPSPATPPCLEISREIFTGVLWRRRPALRASLFLPLPLPLPWPVPVWCLRPGLGQDGPWSARVLGNPKPAHASPYYFRGFGPHRVTPNLALRL